MTPLTSIALRQRRRYDGAMKDRPAPTPENVAKARAKLRDTAVGLIRARAADGDKEAQKALRKLGEPDA
jgi:hypothetical protein